MSTVGCTGTALLLPSLIMQEIQQVVDTLIPNRIGGSLPVKLQFCKASQMDLNVPPLLATGVAVDVLVELISKQPTAEQLLENPEPIDEPVSSSYSSVIAGIKTKGKAK